jgi:predicted nuclease of restriction endonuclease-like RecB superfamily
MENKYRSKLEESIGKDLENKGIQFNFEPDWGKIHYTIPAKQAIYVPDFYVKTRSGKIIIIEGKGIWVYEDRYKHLLIKNSRPDLDIRFVFSNSKNKIRKNSKTTYADICEGKGRGFFKGKTWQYADKKIPEEWLNE